MSERDSLGHATSRRSFLAAGGAAVVTSAFSSAAWAASHEKAPAKAPAPKAKFHRLSLEGTGAGSPAKMLASYKKAISAMLKLPPTDPRNWYRNALVHTLDCPHQNWWFLPWHRGYTGWFEQTCRQLSGDPTFALPFWDWTKEPRIPKAFFDGVLDPSNKAYIASFAAFQKAFTTPVADFWNGLSPAQITQLNARGFNSVGDVWDQLPFMFFTPGDARSLTPENPDFDPPTRAAVSLRTLRDSIASKVFADAAAPTSGFGSFIATQHSQGTGEGILESQPHDNVHGEVGGFMSSFLSPVDPIFFMHHSNIDRLWDVWTRKQQKLSLPTLPTGSDLGNWQKEPFLFFVDSNGKPVSKNTAGDYATIGAFNYDYAPGSGDQFIPKTVLTAAAAIAKVTPQLFKAAVATNALAMGQGTPAQVSVPEALLRAAGSAGGPTIVAQISVQFPAKAQGVRLYVLVNPPAGAVNVPLTSPYYAGSFRLFGPQHHGGPVTFVVPLTDTVKALRDGGMLNLSEPLRIVVAPDRGGVALSAVQANLIDVTVGVH